MIIESALYATLYTFNPMEEVESFVHSYIAIKRWSQISISDLPPRFFAISCEMG